VILVSYVPVVDIVHLFMIGNYNADKEEKYMLLKLDQ